MFSKYILIFCLLCSQAMAQEITGRVMSLDDAGNMEDLPGATVYYQPDKKGGVVGTNGMFSIKVQQFPGWLYIRSVGFKSDSVWVTKSQFFHVHLRAQDSELSEVKVVASPGGQDVQSIQSREVLTMKTLAKAACCNLSESFETNASVSVNFSDAVTGAKQISLLGLSGTYVQTQVENVPSIRGLKSTYGLNYIPGTWIRSIDLSKGQSSVVNGYESMTGAINMELAKPDTSEVYFLNAYGNSQGRFEVNQQAAHKFNGKLSTALLTHYSQQAARIDGNGDGFMDLPLFNLINVMNRWKYATEHWMVQAGASYLRETRLAGQNGFDEQQSNRYQVYGFGSNTGRFEAFAKIARLFPTKPWKGVGLILSTSQHQNDAYFAFKQYAGREQSMFGNLIYQSMISNTNHTWKAGASFLYDAYQERYLDSSFARTELVPGFFGEYTLIIPNKFTFVVGNRIDFHNQLGTKWVPRMHAKWDITTNWIMRASLGKGWRRVNPLAENMGFLANSRYLQVGADLNPLEEAWNYGVSLSHDFTIGNRKANVVFDYFQTDFTHQWMVDMETAHAIRMYSNPGVSYAKSAQIEFNYSPLPRLEWKTAFRFQDVASDYWGQNGSLRRLTKPFLNRDRVLVNLAYATKYDILKFDLTWQWSGARRIPNAYVHAGDAPEVSAPAFSMVYGQVTRQFKHWEMYLGVENLFNFTQPNPIMGAADPFALGFDATMVWGPVAGRMVYTGLRYKIN
ncbi:MAG: TonB-dependent receptor [Cytophagaceae bacterium]|nr:TonB-dependent receptor [Cytophagaceae bacterium]